MFFFLVHFIFCRRHCRQNKCLMLTLIIICLYDSIWILDRRMACKIETKREKKTEKKYTTNKYTISQKCLCILLYNFFFSYNVICVHSYVSTYIHKPQLCWTFFFFSLELCLIFINIICDGQNHFMEMDVLFSAIHTFL